MKVTITSHVLYRKGFDGKDDFQIAMFPMETCGYVTVRQQDFAIEVDDSFDPTALQVAALKAEQARVNEEFAERCNQIQSAINKLTALECSCPAT